MFLIASLIPWMMAVAILGVSVRSVILAVRLPKVRAGKEPRCEVCSYAVAGLQSFICPECGNDVRTTGIITPTMEARRRGSYTAGALGWIVISAAVLIAAALLWHQAGLRRLTAIRRSQVCILQPIARPAVTIEIYTREMLLPDTWQQNSGDSFRLVFSNGDNTATVGGSLRGNGEAGFSTSGGSGLPTPAQNPGPIKELTRHAFTVFGMAAPEFDEPSAELSNALIALQADPGSNWLPTSLTHLRVIQPPRDTAPVQVFARALRVLFWAFWIAWPVGLFTGILWIIRRRHRILNADRIRPTPAAASPTYPPP